MTGHTQHWPPQEFIKILSHCHGICIKPGASARWLTQRVDSVCDVVIEEVSIRPAAGRIRGRNWKESDHHGIQVTQIISIPSRYTYVSQRDFPNENRPFVTKIADDTSRSPRWRHLLSLTSLHRQKPLGGTSLVLRSPNHCVLIPRGLIKAPTDRLPVGLKFAPVWLNAVGPSCGCSSCFCR